MSAQASPFNSSFFRKLRSGPWPTVIIGAFGLFLVWFLLNLIIHGKCDSQCVVSTLSQMLRSSTPIAFAAFCGLMCERAGVTDIGIEGKMLISAMVAYGVNLFIFQSLKEVMPVDQATNLSHVLALLAAVLVALPIASLHAFLSINIKVDQIISGTVINILAIGLTGYIYRQFLAQNLPAGPGTFPLLKIPLLDQIPAFGQIVFSQKPLTYIMLLSAFAIQYMLFYTP